MFIIVFESQAHTVRQGNRLGASPERLSDLLTEQIHLAEVEPALQVRGSVFPPFSFHRFQHQGPGS